MPYSCTLILSVLLSFVATNLYAPWDQDIKSSYHVLAQRQAAKEQFLKRMEKTIEVHPVVIEDTIFKTSKTLPTGEQDRSLYTITE